MSSLRGRARALRVTGEPKSYLGVWVTDRMPRRRALDYLAARAPATEATTQPDAVITEAMRLVEQPKWERRKKLPLHQLSKPPPRALALSQAKSKLRRPRLPAPPRSATLEELLQWMFRSGLRLPRGLTRPIEPSANTLPPSCRNASAAMAIGRLARLGRLDLAERTLQLFVQDRMDRDRRAEARQRSWRAPDPEPSLTPAPFEALMRAFVRGGEPARALAVHREMVQYGVPLRSRTADRIVEAHVALGDAEAAIKAAQRAAAAGARMSRDAAARLAQACGRIGEERHVRAALELAKEGRRGGPLAVARVVTAGSAAELEELVASCPEALRPSENLGRAVVRTFGRLGDAAAAARFAHRAATEAERAGRPLPLGVHAALYDEFARLCAARFLPTAAAGALAELRRRRVYPSAEAFRALFNMAARIAAPSAPTPPPSASAALAAGPLTFANLWAAAVGAGVARRPAVYRAAIHAAASARDVPALQRILRDLSLDPAGPSTGARPSKWTAEANAVSASAPAVDWSAGRPRERIVGQIAAAMCRARDFGAAKKAIVAAGLQGSEQVLLSLVRGLSAPQHISLATEAVAYMVANGVAPSKVTADELLALCGRARGGRPGPAYLSPRAELGRAGYTLPPGQPEVDSLQARAAAGTDGSRRSVGQLLTSAVVNASLRRVSELMGLADDPAAVGALFARAEPPEGEEREAKGGDGKPAKGEKGS